MVLQYAVTESRLLQEVLPCGYVDSALPQCNECLSHVKVNLQGPQQGAWDLDCKTYASLVAEGLDHNLSILMSEY